MPDRLVDSAAKILAGLIDASFYVLDAFVKLAPIIALALFVGLLVGRLGRHFTPKGAAAVDGLTKEAAIYGTSLLFSLLGITIGFFSGNSRTPVIGDVLPAILTFITALLGYFVNKKDGGIIWRSSMPVGLAALLVSTLSGVLIGSQMRIDREYTEAKDKIYFDQAAKFYVDYCYDLATARLAEMKSADMEAGREALKNKFNCALPWGGAVRESGAP